MSSQPAKPTLKKKKKTLLDDDDYILADLKWFKDKQSVQPVPLGDGPPGQTSGEAQTPPVEPWDPSLGGPSTAAVLPQEPPPRERSLSRSPSIPLQLVVQAKSRSPTSKGYASPPPHAYPKAIVKQKGKGKGPPGVKVPPIHVGQSQDLDHGVRSLYARQVPSSTLSPQFPAEDPSGSPFAHRIIHVLGLKRGHSAFTPTQKPVTLVFELTTEEAAQIARWRNRDTSMDDLADSMCISLVSYPSSQCTAALVDGVDGASVDIVKCGHPAKWPSDSSLFALLDATAKGESPQSIALSPPFTQCEPDGSVDLGAYGLSSGVNTLQIFQSRDYSDRAFAIVLHHPTAAQHTELQRLREQDRSWREMLDRLGTFSLPVPTLTIPKVNAMYNRPTV